ncbi:MAG: FkbM family methyltransferase [Flammeovirgaceae bacterium]
MFIRKLLINLLGFEKYLRLISRVFILTYLARIYLKEHFQVRFLKHLVKPGDTCLDIGANLGYFSVPLSHLVGAKGKVFSVEPVPLFREVLMRNVGYHGKGNVQIVPYALGDKDDVVIKMGTPKVDGVIRHGRTEVIEAPNADTAHMHEATMFTPKTLFGNLEQLHFVKCDVEGYEIYIIPQFLEIFAKYQPIIEIEVGPQENKELICKLLAEIGYHPHFMLDNQLYAFEIDQEAHQPHFELYFLTSKHQEQLKPIIHKD